jgi:hypothetical protein
MKKRGRFACPKQKKCPLNTKGRAKNAHARYHQGFCQCAGAHEKIKAAERRYGVEPGD